MSKLIDLTGKTFGYWEVIDRAPNSKDGRARWNCKCTLCNKTIRPVDGVHLRAGHSTSCGCQKMEKMRQTHIKDETGKVYGFLKVKRIATQEEKPRKDREGIYWVCDCLKCGRKNVIVFGDYLRNGDTTSCGCIQSKNESRIAQLLNENNIFYKQQYRFPDLTSTGRACDFLPFDFGIINPLNQQLFYIIEYDGQQHFNPAHSWKQHGFETTHANDLLKNKYCFDHNIPIIRIPYDASYNVEDLFLSTSNFVLTPENEQEYYNRK